MVRKLVLAVAAASALMSSNMVQALGVGEINLRSALNQPLEAEIELLQVRDLSSSEIRPLLASPDDFGKAGIERSFFLTDLTFTPVVRPDGKAVIKVTSTRPVKEPYLNFLMEVRWPSGRVLREFTLLLDPPLYQPTPVTASAPVARSATPATGDIVRPAPGQPASAAAAGSQTPRTAAPRQPAGQASGEWKTNHADTLWEIALKSRPQGASVQQTMLAIQDINPTAFSGNNINNLRANHTLNLPTAEQAAARSHAEAVAEVASQTASWRNRAPASEPTARQLDARERDAAGPAPSQSSNEDSLRLVSGTDEASETNTDSAADGENGGLRDALDRTKEQLDSTEREKDELTDRLADLEGQLDTLQRLLELKDAQLAALQQELSGNGELPDVLPVPAEEGGAETALEESLAPVETLPEEPVESSADMETDAEPAGNGEEASDETDASEEQLAVAPVATPTNEQPSGGPGDTAPEQPAPVAPVSEQPRMDSGSPEALLQRFMQNQSLLLGAGAVALLVLLLILMAVARRNARREAELADSFIAQSALAGDNTDAGSEGSDFNVALAGAQTDAADDMDLARDPLVEADALIAYGKLDEAAEALQTAIHEEPERTDLRLKMMEVEGLRENPQGYAVQAEALRRMGMDDAAVELMNARYPLMAVGLVTGAALMADGEQAEPAESLSIDDQGGVDDNVALDAEADEFDFTDFGLEEEAAASLADADGREEVGFDLDFDLDESLEESLEENPDQALDEALTDLAETDSTTQPAVEPAPVEPAEQPVSPAPLDDFELTLDDELQADNLLAEFEAMSLAGADNDSREAAAEPDDSSFALTDDDLAGFEAELQSAMNNDAAQVSGEAGHDEFSTTPNEGSMPAENLDDDDFDFLSDTDECATKLDLARAYIDMGDEEGARDILAEVVEEGTQQQQQDARELMGQLG
ncbi:FimV/HubP family polar landmark protein [Halopseudomonas bauzanensis]|uniref:Pilus assembly protein FimV n=1 Tax=Halopseudomonas bauzanensis TaxID=653930 RepID=A0A1H9R977_9GAMM|nr:FimV/HubP family polar landmark protein [Halopseudomonas bauzanensis]SER68493.1 pilus assembly protein FimV [Halopseudomonas bauzanensis]SFL60450.1 pilus assembly protein FimV [Halopseudomonas bauzanensis]